MRESHSDLFEHHRVPGHLVCISTNGFLKRTGAAVMGRGCALQATVLHPGVQMLLGAYLRKNGNAPGILVGKKYMLGILPVKHNWWEKASLELITRSIEWLRGFAMDTTMVSEVETVHAPRLGCGNGGRNWEREVRPLMLGLPDSVVVHY